MIRVKKIIIILFAILFGLTKYVYAQDKIICGALDKYPYTASSMYEGPDGFCVKILELAANESGVEVEWIQGTIDELTQQLATGEIDCIPFMSGSLYNEDNFDVSSINILSLWGSVISLKTYNLETVNDLSMKKVGFLNEDLSAKSYIEIMGDSNIAIIPVWYENLHALEEDLANSVIPAAIVSDYITQNRLSYEVDKSSILLPPVRVTMGFRHGTFMGISARLNKSIEKLIRDQDSEYYTLLKTHKFDDYLHQQGERSIFLDYIRSYFIVISVAVVCFVIFCAFLIHQLRIKSDNHNRFSREFSTIQYFIENLSVPLIVHKVDTGSKNYILLINKEAESFFDKENADWTFDDFFVLGDSEESVGSYIQGLNAGEQVSFAVRLKSDIYFKNKFEFTTQIMPSSDKAFTFIDNHTSQVAIYESLQNSQYELEMATEAGKVGVFEYDVSAAVITGSNQLFVNLGIGYREEGISYNELITLIKYSDEKVAINSINSLIAGSVKSCSFVFQVDNEDGDGIWMRLTAKAKSRDSSGIATVLIGVVINFDKIKKLNLELEEMSRNFELLMGISPDLIYSKDLNLNFNWVSSSLASDAGVEDRSALVGKSDFDIHKSDIAQSFYKLEMSVIDKDTPVVDYEQTYVSGSGENRWVLSTKLPIKDNQGTVIGILGMGKDITHYKQALAALNSSQRIKSIGKLAGGIAHDFNNSLNGIMGFANLLQDRFVDGFKEMEYLNFIISGTERCAKLTKHLLAYARKGKYFQTKIDMHNLINSTSLIVENTLDDDVEIVCKLNASNFDVFGDYDQIESVIINLISNAEYAVHGSGYISIETKNVISDKIGETPVSSNMKLPMSLEIKVSDDGEGISKENIDNIFDPFFTTKEIGEASGLGLSAVYGIILNHNGNITVDSDIGVGTCFTIVLPVIEPE